jgi:hypothetical protein
MTKLILLLFILTLPCADTTAAPPRKAAARYAVRMQVTAYCHRGRTATGTRGHVGTCAGPRRLLGRRVWVCGWPYRVTDVCPAGAIDLWMPTRAQCLKWGRRSLVVEIEVR